MQNNVILIGSAGLGGDNIELGGLLLANFLRILSEREDLPDYLLLWNEGVKVAAAGSLWIEHVKKLTERGVRVISCRTCIEYLGMEEQLLVGEIGTMPQIQELLLTNSVLSV